MASAYNRDCWIISRCQLSCAHFLMHLSFHIRQNALMCKTSSTWYIGTSISINSFVYTNFEYLSVLFTRSRESAVTIRIAENLRKCDVHQFRIRLRSWKRGDASAVPPKRGQRKSYSHGARVPSRQSGCDFLRYNEGVLVHFEKHPLPSPNQLPLVYL